MMIAVILMIIGMASDAEIVFGSLNGRRFSVTEYSYSLNCGTTGWWFVNYQKCQFVNLNIETFLHVSDLYNDVAESKGIPLSRQRE
jgi:uncharacterized membrane protein